MSDPRYIEMCLKCGRPANTIVHDTFGHQGTGCWIVHPFVGVTDHQVFEIRELYKAGGTSWQDLARRFGICKRSIGRLIRGESYV